MQKCLNTVIFVIAMFTMLETPDYANANATTTEGATTQTQETDQSKEDTSKYADYMDYYIDKVKCEGYDFEPERVVAIHLSPLKEDHGWRTVVLDNGKKFRIISSTDSCGGGTLKGKDGYKQLLDGCRFTIGSGCISPVPAGCKHVNTNQCWDEDKKGQQDYELFQWEATNKGWERMMTFREYWEDDVE